MTLSQTPNGISCPNSLSFKFLEEKELLLLVSSAFSSGQAYRGDASWQRKTGEST